MSFQLFKKGIVAALILPLAITAQAGKDAKPVVSQESASILSGNVNVQLASEYIAYGAVYHDRDLNVQPSVNLALAVYQNGEGFINNVSIIAGAWGELAKATVATNNPHELYEIDYTAGVSVQFLKNFNLAISHIWFNSPSDDWQPDGTARALNVTLAYNDSEILGTFALKPHFTYLHELNKASVIYSQAPRHGNFFELGIQPSLPSVGIVELSLPVNIAYGSREFYLHSNGKNASFGYFSAGILAEVPLTFVPASYGSWKFNASATYFRLNRDVNPGIDNDRVLYQAGLGVSF